MNSLIKSILPDPVPKTTAGMVNAVREIMQSLLPNIKIVLKWEQLKDLRI